MIYMISQIWYTAIDTTYYVDNAAMLQVKMYLFNFII